MDRSFQCLLPRVVALPCVVVVFAETFWARLLDFQRGNRRSVSYRFRYLKHRSLDDKAVQHGSDDILDWEAVAEKAHNNGECPGAPLAHIRAIA